MWNPFWFQMELYTPGRRKPFPNYSAPELNASGTQGSRGTHSAYHLNCNKLIQLKTEKKNKLFAFLQIEPSVCLKEQKETMNLKYYAHVQLLNTVLGTQ